ncbi:MAG TPA: hypothetical protein VIV66_10040 [Pyrinomonadaceae bacterium]
MANRQELLIAFLAICLFATGVAAQSKKREISPFFPMRNKDVLVLMSRQFTTEEIIATIRASWCNFDIFPPVLQDLKQRGVSTTVLQAMVDAPYGPPADSRQASNAAEPIYHSAEQLKQLGFLQISPVRRDEGFAVDRRGPTGILRQ